MGGKDPVTGRFLPGNKIAKGNKGNRRPKYGNTNALKHGMYKRIAMVANNGWLVIDQGPYRAKWFPPGTFELAGDRVYLK